MPAANGYALYSYYDLIARGKPGDNFSGEKQHPGIYRRPLNLMVEELFYKTKRVAMKQDKWIIANLQSTKEFSSHMLNRDTWSNEVVADIISANFIFWQAYDDTIEGRKVCAYYNLVSFPVVFVLDPFTGERVRQWSGMIEADKLLEELLPFMDAGPKQTSDEDEDSSSLLKPLNSLLSIDDNMGEATPAESSSDNLMNKKKSKNDKQYSYSNNGTVSLQVRDKADSTVMSIDEVLRFIEEEAAALVSSQQIF